LATAPAREYKAAHRHNKDDDDVNGASDSKGTGGVLELEDFARGLPLEARLLGIDLGTKTLGLAISDVTRTIASGLTTLARGKFTEDGRRLLALVEEHRIAGFVLGLPVNLSGTEGPRAQATRAFARNLGRLTSLPILLWDERFSTAAAERALIEADASRRRRAVVIDKVAATLILQAALDRMRRLAGQAQ
jgi:putative holliday junction resolvase